MMHNDSGSISTRIYVIQCIILQQATLYVYLTHKFTWLVYTENAYVLKLFKRHDSHMNSEHVQVNSSMKEPEDREKSFMRI